MTETDLQRERHVATEEMASDHRKTHSMKLWSRCVCVCVCVCVCACACACVCVCLCVCVCACVNVYMYMCMSSEQAYRVYMVKHRVNIAKYRIYTLLFWCKNNSQNFISITIT